jgi:hypothetical protein
MAPSNPAQKKVARGAARLEGKVFVGKKTKVKKLGN